jgi:peptidoglycan lytic transglycosylase F
VETSKASKNFSPWTKVAIAMSAVTLLGTYAPVPDLLGQIRALGELRVVTRTGPFAFYRAAGDEPAGPEFELAQRFANELGVRLKIVPLGTYAEIYAAIESGRAHLAAAALKVPALPIPGVAFAPPYENAREHLIYVRGERRPDALDDIGDGDLQVAADSTHARTLAAAGGRIPNLVWIENASIDTQSLLDDVADGTIDYTIADSAEFAIAHAAHPELRIAFDLPDARALAWAVSARNRGFLRYIDAYFTRIRGNGELASIVQRYYGRARSEDLVGPRDFLRQMQSRLPLYRKWFEEAAAATHADWRLLAAIGYQESHWDPLAASPTGAKGMMQLTRVTANAADVRNPDDARQSIFGGARYFQTVLAKIPAHVPEPDRTWFALAAYNIGFGHLEDARVLAQKAGRNPDSWQDVREFLPLLAQPRWYAQTQNGYARGWEPVRYVDNVRSYRDMLEWAWGPTTASLN